ncbi:MAG: hypothetical protein Q9168_005228 [Polycauliona sp. 1 TL-2023]
MPGSTVAPKTPTSMEVAMAKLYFRRRDALKTTRLPNLQEAALGEFNVGPVLFERNSVSVTSTGGGNACVLRLPGKNCTVQTIAFEDPRRAQSSCDRVIVVRITCRSPPKCEVTAHPGKDGWLKARDIPLRVFANNMDEISLELDVRTSNWTVHGTSKGNTITEIQSQLQMLFAGQSSLGTIAPGDTYLLASADERPVDNSDVPISTPLTVPTATGDQLSSAASNNRSSSPPLPTNRPRATILPSSDGFSLRTNITLPIERLLAIAPLPGSLPQPTPPDPPRRNKRKLENIMVEYEKIDKEEKEFLQQSREKKERLWQESYGDDGA